jgi:membrane protein implicated in regulation of membrane protease activity
MSASDWLWVWIAAAIVLAIAEIVTPFLFFMISFAAGAALATVAAALDAGVALQVLTFAVGSGGALAVLVPLGRRIAQSDGEDTVEGAARWVGRMAVVLEDIPADAKETGLVRLERARWKAETHAGNPIVAGEEVEVVAVRGTRLIVAPLDSIEEAR